MKTSYVDSGTYSDVSCLGWALEHHAQDTDGVREKVGFEFIAEKATPACGHVQALARLSADAYSGIEISNHSRRHVCIPDGRRWNCRCDRPEPSSSIVRQISFLLPADARGGICAFALPRALVGLPTAPTKDEVTCPRAALAEIDNHIIDHPNIGGVLGSESVG